MISIREAMVAAKKGLNEIYGAGVPLDIFLEEIESSSNDLEWMITLSFTLPTGGPSLASLFSSTPVEARKKYYKLFIINKSNGEVKAMKIREL